ncbi:hypothetical protein BDP81DRAFT_73463 [Colletotrichum phormii]|uniref:Uncharacterized protein n=1 Tax=Colletotrichum phormii TaxID=359342 RepID=A0AAJ0EBW8_9PEZI|nr:uncharacterized protein BDP81DRAFT_73463 [Colletotrichum phormii]KAK1633414.1 hypothetical protein BDP81DRAFT_73463 [Colletotrichum phormii]
MSATLSYFFIFPCQNNKAMAMMDLLPLHFYYSPISFFLLSHGVLETGGLHGQSFAHLWAKRAWIDSGIDKRRYPAGLALFRLHMYSTAIYKSQDSYTAPAHRKRRYPNSKQETFQILHHSFFSFSCTPIFDLKPY